MNIYTRFNEPFLFHTRLDDEQYWLGLKKVDGNWQWLDGSSYGTGPEFLQSNNADEECARVIYYNNEWIWADCPCVNEYRSICMKGKVERKVLLVRNLKKQT
jgi:hypothetical protein